MRIGINARTLAAPRIRGWTRYTAQLLRHLPALGAELVLFSDRALNPENLELLAPGSFRVVVAPPMRYLVWEQMWLPMACARERIELLHAPANYGLPCLGTCPRVLTLHDAIDAAFEPTRAPRGARQRAVDASFWVARHAARRVITVSEHAKADLQNYFSIAPQKISVIHEASDLHERASSRDDDQQLFDSLSIRSDYVLYAGGFERRKNVQFLVNAFRSAAIEPVSLVLVGNDPPAFIRAEAERANQIRPGSIYVTGFLPDTALAALYRRALVFVYPSLYEGFGLQLCEAMSFGCPTLAADTTSLPEVLGDGGDTFSPTQPASLVARLQRVTHDASYRQALVVRASRRAKDFSWQRTAKLTYDVYRALV